MAAFAKEPGGRSSGGGNQHPALLERQDCTLVAWYRFFTHLAREGRMTVTIGRRELLASTRRRGDMAARGARAAGRARATDRRLDKYCGERS